MANQPKTTTAAPAAKADNKTPRERFTSVGAKRVSKAIKALRNLVPVSNRKSYEFTASDVAKMNSALDSELSAVKASFSAALEGKTAAKSESGFNF